MPFQAGYGYEGVLAFDPIEDKIQCHFCGEWFITLQHHLRREHSMAVKEYKEKTGLNQNTALISEGLRAKLIANGLARRLKNLRPNLHHSEATKKKIGESLRKNRRETQNIHGTCPEQLITRLRVRYDELGRTPTQDEIRGYDTICKVWGSWKRACEIAGVPWRKPNEKIEPTKSNHKYTREVFTLWIRAFIEKNHTQPLITDFCKAHSWGALRAARSYGGWSRLCKDANQGEMRYERIKNLKYTKDDLLDALVNFSKQNNRLPSRSDCVRGLLPTYRRYCWSFGSWKKAIRLSGLDSKK